MTTQAESSASSTPALFSPIQVGRMTLQHRVVMAPLTRFRADKNHVPLDLVRVHYEQRASTPGTLIISEGTFPTARAGGYDNVPGIWSDAQIESWKRVTDAVHAKGSFIYLQLWVLGRAAHGDILLREDPALDVVSASAIPLGTSSWTPRALTVPEIKEYVRDYAAAAANAVHRAGFDGVEVHAANGYLLDQFIQTTSNIRTDEYGGSVENRARFALEVVDAVVAAVGADRTGVRFSPWSTFQEMRMPDPIPTFSHLVTSLAAAHPDLAYVHLVDPRWSGTTDIPGGAPAGESNDFIRAIWAPRRLISAGGFRKQNAISVAEEKGDLIAFGRHFIANPDLVERLKKYIPLHKYDRKTFYAVESPDGYIDLPFAHEEFPAKL